MTRTPNPQGATGAGTLAPVTASATVVTLFTATTGRPVNRRAIFNDSNVALYVKYGSAASLTDWSVKIAIGGYFELPLPLWGGQVTGIWDTGPTGQARLTEY